MLKNLNNPVSNETSGLVWVVITLTVMMVLLMIGGGIGWMVHEPDMSAEHKAWLRGQCLVAAYGAGIDKMRGVGYEAITPDTCVIALPDGGQLIYKVRE